jgi:molybdate transport system ATP-binding protein
MLEIDVRHRLGAFTLDARFTSEGRVTALFGPSGAGKTSLVNCLAGLIRPERGRIVVDGQVLFDDHAGVCLPPHRRRIGYVFQEGRLFPHLTVRQNLLYGRWFTPAGERRASVESIVDLLGLRALLDRRPAGLSGGEKQRVALGRALLTDPRLLLMDEPLASLDAARKEEILPYIERLRDETRVPMVYVSHSVPEVTRLASTLVVLSEGRVEAAGQVGAVMSRLDLVGVIGREEAGAVLETVVAGIDSASGLSTLRSLAGDLYVPRLDLRPGTPVRVRIRARDVMIATRPPGDLSALNVLEGKVAEVGDGDAASVEIRLDCRGEPLVARLTRHSVARLDIRAGRHVYAVIKAVAIDGPVERAPGARVAGSREPSTADAEETRP